MSKFYVFMADGFEEIEALAPIDILRRAGADVALVAVGSEHVTGAHGVTVVAPDRVERITEDDWIVLPGGMPGASNLAACEWLDAALKAHAAAGGNIAAICASPAVVLASKGIVNDRLATCYPGFEQQLIAGGANYVETGVVVDDNIITAPGPGYAIEFGLTIVEQAFGEAAADDVAAGMLLK